MPETPERHEPKPTPLTEAQRRKDMPYGAQAEVAEELGVSESFVSYAMRDDVPTPRTPAGRESLRRVREALARKLELPMSVAFPSVTPDVTPDVKQEAAPKRMARAS